MQAHTFQPARGPGQGQRHLGATARALVCRPEARGGLAGVAQPVPEQSKANVLRGDSYVVYERAVGAFSLTVAARLQGNVGAQRGNFCRFYRCGATIERGTCLR